MPVDRLIKGGISKADAEMIHAKYKAGMLSKKQYDKLPAKLLLGIVKKGDSKGGVKEKRVKTGKNKGKRGRPRKGTKVMVEE
tara:strand:- start:472 stop:717 length:246 start_codon:yes stop_codon:yes gene_type:complete